MQAACHGSNGPGHSYLLSEAAEQQCAAVCGKRFLRAWQRAGIAQSAPVRAEASPSHLTSGDGLPRVSTLTFMDSIAQLNAFTVFLAIAAVGFLFLMISLFFGGMLEHFDGALDHDLDHGGPGFFSTRVISVFITAFGGFGAIATHYGFGTLPASLIGALSGVVLATPIYYFARFLYGQQASSDNRAQDLVGLVGRVVIAIPVGGVGQVRCKLARNWSTRSRAAATPHRLPRTTPVVIEEVVGETVVVRRR